MHACVQVVAPHWITQISIQNFFLLRSHRNAVRILQPISFFGAVTDTGSNCSSDLNIPRNDKTQLNVNSHLLLKRLAWMLQRGWKCSSHHC